MISSDLYERGYGESGRDFLTATRTAENIITTHLTMRQRLSCGLACSALGASSPFCCALPSWRAQTGPGRSCPDPSHAGVGVQRTDHVLPVRR